LTASPLAAHSSSPVELRERVEAERHGGPFLLYRNGAGKQRLVRLDPGPEQLIVGRRQSNEVPLSWDLNVSRVHAQTTVAQRS